VLTEQAYSALDEKDPVDDGVVEKFKEHDIHTVLAECAKLRPSVDIFVE
jgi:ketol-acid reductoisomerase